MTFKNMIFETDLIGKVNMEEFQTNPEGKSNVENPESYIHVDISEGKSFPYKIKITANERMSRSAYDNLTMQLLYNNVKLHNIKFFIPENETENIERFIFNKENKRGGKKRYYLQHMRRCPNDLDNVVENEKYTAKISCYNRASKEEIVKLTSFLRQYL